MNRRTRIIEHIWLHYYLKKNEKLNILHEKINQTLDMFAIKNFRDLLLCFFFNSTSIVENLTCTSVNWMIEYRNCFRFFLIKTNVLPPPFFYDWSLPKWVLKFGDRGITDYEQQKVDTTFDKHERTLDTQYWFHLKISTSSWYSMNLFTYLNSSKEYNSGQNVYYRNRQQHSVMDTLAA